MLPALIKNLWCVGCGMAGGWVSLQPGWSVTPMPGVEWPQNLQVIVSIQASLSAAPS